MTHVWQQRLALGGRGLAQGQDAPLRATVLFQQSRSPPCHVIPSSEYAWRPGVQMRAEVVWQNVARGKTEEDATSKFDSEQRSNEKAQHKGVVEDERSEKQKEGWQKKSKIGRQGEPKKRARRRQEEEYGRARIKGGREEQRTSTNDETEALPRTCVLRRPGVHPVKHGVEAARRPVDVRVLLLVRHNWPAHQLVLAVPRRGPRQA